MASPRISYVVGRLDRAISLEMARLIADYGLTVPRYTALSVLASDRGLSNAQLARRTFVRPQSMIQVVNALESEGLITRSPDESHKRIFRTSLTAKGESVLQACNAAVDAMEKTMLAGISAAERAGLQAALASCIERLGSDSGEPPMR